MNAHDEDSYDVVGIGFGPSNLSLAISLEEHHANLLTNQITSRFFERQPSFGWHRNMLLPSATMQIAFLKDLVTFRNPVSRFSFVSFLHAQNRLAQFVNRKDFFPTRQEFHQYLEWAAGNMSSAVSYDSAITEIRRPPDAGRSPAEHLQLAVLDNSSGTTRSVTARNIVISTGLVPRMPDGFTADDHVWHSSEFLTKFGLTRPGDLRTVAVVGAGQSAAEITTYFYNNLPGAQVHAILPSYGYSVADDTPFANQIFDPDAVEDYYDSEKPARDAYWRYHRNTNYAVVDAANIAALYQIQYDEEVTGAKRLHVHNLTRVQDIERHQAATRLWLTSLRGGEPTQLGVDVVVFATGYRSMDPADLLADLDRYCLRDESGLHQVTRDYRLVTTADLSCGIYLQGGTEHTHGLTSSLLSNIAVRSGQIADSIVARRLRPPTDPDLQVQWHPAQEETRHGLREETRHGPREETRLASGREAPHRAPASVASP